MTRLTAKDFPQQLLEYYNCYAHSKISRHELLQLTGEYTVGGVTALALFNLLKPDYALAEQVLFTDPGIRPEYVHYPSPDGHDEVRAHLVTPTKIADKTPAVVVVHENRGLNPYTKGITRRVARTGCITLAPDGLGAVGDYPGNGDEGRALQQKVDPTELMNDFSTAVASMAKHPQAMGKIGITRFCYDGGINNAAAAAVPELACAVPFCGHQPPLKRVDKIKAPLLPHYASLGSGINEGQSVYEQALGEHHKVYETYLYQGVNHDFHNDPASRYDWAAADLAWQRTLTWFEKHLRQRKRHKQRYRSLKETLYNLLCSDWKGAIENHSGKDLMTGLQVSHTNAATYATNFCTDYKRGFVLGYSYRTFEKTDGRQLSAWEAGILARRYDLDRGMMMGFFREGGSGMTMYYFLAGYRLES